MKSEGPVDQCLLIPLRDSILLFIRSIRDMRKPRGLGSGTHHFDAMLTGGDLFSCVGLYQRLGADWRLPCHIAYANSQAQNRGLRGIVSARSRHPPQRA